MSPGCSPLPRELDALAMLLGVRLAVTDERDGTWTAEIYTRDDVSRVRETRTYFASDLPSERECHVRLLTALEYRAEVRVDEIRRRFEDARGLLASRAA